MKESSSSQPGAAVVPGGAVSPSSLEPKPIAWAPSAPDTNVGVARADYGVAGSYGGSPGRSLMGWDGRPLSPDFASRKVTAGVLAILFGQLGVHKFMLGYISTGLIMLGITLVSIPLCLVFVGFFGIAAMVLIGLIEGIIYLTKGDDEFVIRYGVNRKSWF